MSFGEADGHISNMPTAYKEEASVNSTVQLPATPATTEAKGAHAAGSPRTGIVVSRDGTRIAYSRVGSGKPLILVDGALNDRSLPGAPNPKLAAALSSRFTVFTYDRRGRGESGDSHSREVAREVEDLAALVEAAGGSAHVYGISSGGALALEAAGRLPSIRGLALYELPFVVDNSRAPIPAEFADHLAELAREDRRAEALRYFFSVGIGLPRLMVMMMRLLPAWSKLKALAHTLPDDARLIGDAGSGRPLPTDRWADVAAPTIVIAGTKSPAWMRHAMRSLAEVLPNAKHHELEGQTHIVKPKALAPVLREFFQE
jgi:pimeloyl-ACP methyl ester carboxylesterase